VHDDIIIIAVAMMSSCTLAECCGVKVPSSPLIHMMKCTS